MPLDFHRPAAKGAEGIVGCERSAYHVEANWNVFYGGGYWT